MYDILEGEKGKKNEIFLVCDEFNNPIYCLKKASQQNPELRTEICDKLVVDMGQKYKGRMPKDKLDSFIDGHKGDCLVGIPQFMY